MIGDAGLTVELVVFIGGGAAEAVSAADQVAFGVVAVELSSGVVIAGDDEAVVGIVGHLGAVTAGVDAGGFVAGGIVFDVARLTQGIRGAGETVEFIVGEPGCLIHKYTL